MPEDSIPDYGVPDDEFIWPDVAGLRVADAVRLLYDIEEQATVANARAERLKKRKATARVIIQQVLEREELESGRAKTRDGKTIQYTPSTRDVFHVTDEEAFKAWAEEDAERYYDDTPRLREGIFLDEMRRRLQDKEPLPPGVQHVPLPTINRTAVASKRRS